MTGVVSGLMTLFLIILFLGIVFWAYSKRNKPVFEEMAAIPLVENQTSSSIGEGVVKGKEKPLPIPPLIKGGRSTPLRTDVSDKRLVSSLDKGRLGGVAFKLLKQPFVQQRGRENKEVPHE